MKSSLTCVALIVVVLAACAAAFAGPGDPRLVNGVLEWPRGVTNEPFIVVRGDDGAFYYVTIAAARRDATLGAGARLAVLGFEGRTAHEISALGVGVGDSVESALANLQGAKPAPTAAAPVTPNGGAAIAAPTAKSPAATTQGGVVSGARPPTPPTNSPTTPTAAAPAAPATAPAPNTASTPNGSAAATAPAPAVTAPPPPATAPAPAVTAPPPPVTAPAPAVTPTTPGVGPYPAVISAPTAPPAVAATTPTPPKPAATDIAPASAPTPPVVRDERRWTEITGVVESISGRTLVLRAPEGRVAVDMSSLNSNLERIVTPGATVRVYGLPVELRFKAMGFFDPGGRP